MLESIVLLRPPILKSAFVRRRSWLLDGLVVLVAFLAGLVLEVRTNHNKLSLHEMMRCMQDLEERIPP